MAHGKTLQINKQKADRKKEEKLFNDSHKLVLFDFITRMFYRKVETNYTIHCGKTNSGKTYNAIEALKQSESGVYLAPLRLLAWEIADKLNEQGFSCSLVTGEEQIIKDDALFISSTIEMLNYDSFYDTVVIDEAFMIGDRDRGKSWTKAILDCNANNVHIIVNHEALNVITEILGLTGRRYKVEMYEMLQKFKFADKPMTYSKDLKPRGVFVTFSRMGVLINKMKLEELGKNVSVLYGNLPPETKKTQIENFISGKTELLVTTDVIGMGLNIPCDYICFLDIEKYDGISNRNITPTEIKQIAGRTGRYGMSSDDSFVSANHVDKLNYIASNYHRQRDVKKAYVGFDFDMFCSFPEFMSVAKRVDSFLKIDFIPTSLHNYITKESVEKYISICDLVDRPKFSIDVKWTFLTAPIKESIINYFSSCVYTYEIYGEIRPPSVDRTYADIKRLEDNICEIELYLNLSRTLNHDAAQKEKYKTIKYELIEKLNLMLLEKKGLKKKCKLCTEMLSISYPYPYCQPCYNNKVRRDYDDYDYWND